MCEEKKSTPVPFVLRLWILNRRCKMQKHNAKLTPLIACAILTTRELLARGFDLDGTAGDGRIRWQNSTANDDAWRVAA
jgi:hypothetical protein